MVDTSNVEMIKGLQNDYSNIKIKIKDKDNEVESEIIYDKYIWI